MPIVVNLDLMLVKRKMSLTQLSEKVNVTLANLSILKQNKARAIRSSTLGAICDALQCQPGDLIEWRPDGTSATGTPDPDR
jgi:putative transcriptional regulator